MDASEEGRGTVVVRAHGLPREEQPRLRGDWPELLDATCPHVRRVQKIVEEYAGRGYMCIVVGDRGHAEVEGVLSYADGAGYVVSGPDEVDALPDAEHVVVVAQTTRTRTCSAGPSPARRPATAPAWRSRRSAAPPAGARRRCASWRGRWTP